MGLVDEAMELRKRIEAHPANTAEDVRVKERFLKEAEERTARLRYAADLLISVEFQPASSSGHSEDLLIAAAIQAGEYVKNGALDEFKRVARKAIGDRRTLHWPLEFPEVCLERGGFSAFVGNPPFMGGAMVSGALGDAYLAYLLKRPHVHGNGDLCAHFFRRTYELISPGGVIGLLGTKSIGQTTTKYSGLEYITSGDGNIIRAETNRSWPGSASVLVAYAVISRGLNVTPRYLNGTEVTFISADLSAEQPESLCEK